MTPEGRVQERALSATEFTSPFVRSETMGDKIAVLIPGIRTNAEWIDEAANDLDTFSGPIILRKAYGGRISSRHLVTRIGLRKIRDDVKNQLLHIIAEHSGAKISLICHSMGTDIISDILDDVRHRFEYIFFLGAVCHARKAAKISKSCDFFVNHRGTFDYWPIVAEILRPRKYSATGTFGFNRSAYVNDLLFNNNHETCTQKFHIYKYVLPTIIGTKPLYPKKIIHPFDLNFCFYIRWAIYFATIAGFSLLHFSLYSVLLPLAVLLFSSWYFLKRRPLPKEASDG
jgi:hypothetical protein